MKLVSDIAAPLPYPPTAVAAVDESVAGDLITVDHTPYEASSNASSATGDRGRTPPPPLHSSTFPPSTPALLVAPYTLLFGELPSSAKDGSIGIPN